MTKCEVLTVKDVMELLDCGWETAVRYMEWSGALLPRRGKGSPYIVIRKKFMDVIGISA